MCSNDLLNLTIEDPVPLLLALVSMNSHCWPPVTDRLSIKHWQAGAMRKHSYITKMFTEQKDSDKEKTSTEGTEEDIHTHLVSSSW